ncbi:hypothetical protein AVI51_09950 [Piscirickettsia salmonis]|uniref:Uncharacterized protein n=1 Tax=Piscirickettsia salmonis TaxID=1238 RepID=A0A9Q5VC30_PISSA|nr:hypothetical protein [Piscirickettsia salmonis]RNC76876.1 hypothetical protein DA717_13455 [Piscirickettsiaceae bacterium NZ-RLO2]ALA23614.1 mu-like prophage FluMu gp41 family protein [Piscirickettsia salmonis]APS44059.1 hypothetical protein AVI48_06570 [Piscirickettsia salmonis]APS47418.1 hypothetical protein AVI49_07175 [Piscirickettsia salmonis]APS51147.1 hypothetical protein AVI50_10055 [Piscirickettsia salmonis]
MKSISLSEEIILPSLNVKEGKDQEFSRNELNLKAIKYKDFRKVMLLPEEDQMHTMMKIVSGLSEDDIGELSAEDTAEISEYVFESIHKYVQLGQKITNMSS